MEEIFRIIARNVTTCHHYTVIEDFRAGRLQENCVGSANCCVMSWKWNKSHRCGFPLPPSSRIIRGTLLATVGSTSHLLACQKPPRTDPSCDYRGLGEQKHVHVDMNGCSGVNWFTLLCLCRSRGRAGDKLMPRRLSSEFCTKNRTPSRQNTTPPPFSPPVTPNNPHPPTKSNESTRKWCKVTGCPHLAAWTAAQTPEAP